MSDLNFSTRQIDGVTILELSGRIMLGESSSELRENLRSLVEEGRRRIVINLSKVTSVDSSGLGTLVASFASLEKNGGQLKLASISPKMSELMTITKLYTVFEIFDKESVAIASFEKAGAKARETQAAGAAGNESSIL